VVAGPAILGVTESGGRCRVGQAGGPALSACL